MNSINDESIVKKQYANANNLNTRSSIHDKYSTNKQGFGKWIFSNYKLERGMKVLELGCGNGDLWRGRKGEIEDLDKLVLSDFSEGMLAAARENVGEHHNVCYKVINIMDIPYEDESFDVVIANMMLYHVPDINKGLSEVRRVLKKDGVFYTAT